MSVHGYLAASLLTAALAGVALADPPAERFGIKTNQLPIPFSSSAARDTLLVEVDGASCDEARFRLEVRSEQGAELYRFEAPYYQLVASDCSRKTLGQVIGFEDLRYMLTQTLPHLPLAESSSEYGFETLVPQADYERLCAAHAAVFEHAVAPGESIWIAYDAKLAKGVAVLRKKRVTGQSAHALRVYFANANDQFRFSGKEARDTLFVEIDGDSCREARVHIEIRSEQDRVLYRFEAPYAQVVGSDCSERTATEYLNGVLFSPPVSRALPRFPTPESVGERGFDILVPKETYERIRLSQAALFEHAIAPGEVLSIAYDAETATGIAVLQTGDAAEEAARAKRAAKRAPGFNFSESARIRFSSKEPTDLLTVSATGTACNAATFRVLVQDAQGRELYRYETPYENLGGDLCDPDSAEDFISQTLDDAGRETTSSLPSFPTPEQQDSLWEVMVPKETYERLRAADLPLIQFMTCYECSQEVVYDPETKRGVVLVESGS